MKQRPDLRLYKPYVTKLPVKALYGLYLIQLCREADEIGEATGKFVEVEFPTLEEFRAMHDEIVAARKGGGAKAKKFVRNKGGKRK